MSETRERVLVTGASAGIGRELARVFATEGCDLVLVARRAERLEELATELRAARGIDARVMIADLGRPETPRELVARLEDQGVGIDVLVNNAGFGLNGTFGELDLARQLEMIQVNVTSLVELSGLLVPGMIERQRGGVLNVASTAAFQPGPRMAIYYATKAFVLSFSEALFQELRGSGVRACCLCPGPTESEFMEVANLEETRLFRMTKMSAERVARIGLAALRADRPLAIPGMLNKLGTLGVRLTPRAVVRRMVEKIM
jgi:short-subunit dehydrogenase